MEIFLCGGKKKTFLCEDTEISLGRDEFSKASLGGERPRCPVNDCSAPLPSPPHPIPSGMSFPSSGAQIRLPPGAPGFHCGSDAKESACNAVDLGSIPGSGRSLGEGNSNPLQYPCLENPMNRGASCATVHGVAKSRMQLSDFTSPGAPFSLPSPLHTQPEARAHPDSHNKWPARLCTASTWPLPVYGLESPSEKIKHLTG